MTESDTERDRRREKERGQSCSVLHTPDSGNMRDMLDTVTRSQANDGSMSEKSGRDFSKEPTEQLQLTQRRLDLGVG